MNREWKESSTLKSKNKVNSLSKDHFEDDSFFKINVICNTSKELHKEYFSNKIATLDTSNVTRSNIKAILELDQQEINVKSLPFNTEEGNLEINSKNKYRLQNIFSLYEIKFNEEDEILKCSYKNKIGLLYHINQDLLRVFLRIKTCKSIDVLLIDPYHLVATNKYKELFYQHKSEFKYCYSKLKTK